MFQPPLEMKGQDFHIYIAKGSTKQAKMLHILTFAEIFSVALCYPLCSVIFPCGFFWILEFLQLYIFSHIRCGGFFLSSVHSLDHDRFKRET
jgi:hypothetical protein